MSTVWGPNVKKPVVFGIVVTGVLALATATVASVALVTKGSLPARTTGAVNTLIAHENAVTGKLEQFKRMANATSVTGWMNSLKSLEAAQNSAISALNADLAASSTSNSSSPSKSTGNGIGTTIGLKDTNGNKFNVSLLNVIDPAQGADQYTTPDAGKRFVGVEFRVTDISSASINDDANSDTAVIGSDNQTYSPDFDSIAGCTNFNDGSYTLTKNESVTGCVVFQVPTGVNVSKVQYGSALGFGLSDVAQWSI